MTNHKHETNKILLYYKILPSNLRNKFKQAVSEILNISDSRLHQRILHNFFAPHERALLSYHLGIPQNILFPNQLAEYRMHEDYKLNNRPLYKSFFEEHNYIYDPENIAELLKTEQIPIGFKTKKRTTV